MSKNNIRSIKSSHALNPNHNHNNGIMNGHINVHNNINSNLSNNSKLFSIHGDNFDKIKN